MSKNSIPGWQTHIDEILNGVFKVIVTDANGRKAEIIDNATDETIERAVGYAFDIEKQISLNWNLFLYELAIKRLSAISFVKKEYDNKAFGSWLIEKYDKRLIYDGKESYLIIQIRVNDEWEELESINKSNLKYMNFIKLIKQMYKDRLDK